MDIISVNYKKIGIFLLVLIIFNVIFFNSLYNGKFSENKVVNLVEDKSGIVEDGKINAQEESRGIDKKTEDAGILKKASKKDLTGDLLRINQDKGFASEFITVLEGEDIDGPNVIIHSPINDSNYKINVFNITLGLNVSDLILNRLNFFVYAWNYTTSMDPYESLVYKGLESHIGAGNNYTYNITALPVDSSDPDLLLLFHFDNRSEYGENESLIYDFSGNHRNNGTVVFGNDGSFLNNSGKFDGGFYFNSSGVGFPSCPPDCITPTYIDVRSFNDFRFGSDSNFSWGAWFKVTGNTIARELNIIDRINGPIINLHIAGEDWNQGAGGKIVCRLGAGNLVEAFSSFRIKEDEWYQAICVRDVREDKLKLYINGRLDNEVTDTTTGGWSTFEGFRLRVHTWGNNPFNGTIDEIAVWNRSLTEQEIRNLYRLKEGTYFWKVNVSVPNSLNSNESYTNQFNIVSPTFCDNFNRVDSSNLGANWFEVSPDNLAILNSALYMESGFLESIALVNNENLINSYDSAQSIKCRDIYTENPAFFDTCSLVARYVDNNNYYFVNYTRPVGLLNRGRITLSKKIGGVITNVIALNNPYNVVKTCENSAICSSNSDCIDIGNGLCSWPENLGLIVDGTRLVVYLDDIKIISVFDTDLQDPNSKIGLYGYRMDAISNGVNFDDYKSSVDPLYPVQCFIECVSDLDCNDGVSCTLDSCDLSTNTCVSVPNNFVCDDGNQCTVNTCDPSNTGADVDGCVFDSLSMVGLSCDDGVSCTTNDLCNLAGECIGVPDDGLCPSDAICGNWFCDTLNDCSVNYDPSTKICRTGIGLCDIAEFCTGNSDQCPPDNVFGFGTECRSSVGVCDIAEVCDGISANCPLDVKSTDLCRPSTGECDVAEFCDGLSSNCPVDLNQPDGTLCGDGLYCNGVETCQIGACTSGLTVNCNDVVSCTVDSCDEGADLNDNFGQCINNPNDLLCDDGISCTTNICNVVLGCQNPEIDNDLDTYSICPGINFDCDDNNFNTNPGASEICTDGFDNNCNNECDYDTSLPCTLHGDIACPAGIISISASNSNPFENTNIEISCNSNIANVNSIQAYLDSISCIFDRWENNNAIFICNVGSVGVKTAKCTVDLSKSYQLGEDKITQINVMSSVCSDYNTEVECPTSICEWCSACSGTKSSGLAQDTCINLGTCGYICIANSCGAVCDPNIGCSSTDCDYLDGCVGRDYYDYSDVPNSCLSDCSCESNLCGIPIITFDDPTCISLTTTTTTEFTTTTSELTSTSSSTSSTTEFTTTSTSTSSTTFGTAETITTSTTSSTVIIYQPPSGGGGGRRIQGGVKYVCNDGIDNDKDGYCDLKDSTCIDGSIPGDRGCYSIFDDNETNFIEPPYLKPPETCKVCYGNKDISNLNVLSEFFDYQDYFNNIYQSNNIECCECNINGIQDLGEEGVDCGGICPKCEITKVIWPKCEITIWLIIFSLILLLIQFLINKLNKLSSFLVGIYVLTYLSLEHLVLNCNILNILGGVIIIYQLYIISRKREISFL